MHVENANINIFYLWQKSQFYHRKRVYEENGVFRGYQHLSSRSVFRLQYRYEYYWMQRNVDNKVMVLRQSF